MKTGLNVTLGNEARYLALYLSFVDGKIALPTEIFQQFRASVKVLPQHKREALIGELLAMAVRLEREKRPQATAAVAQFLILAAELLKKELGVQ